MTQEEIIEMAKQVGFEEHQAKFDTRFEPFAKLVAAKEREACMNVLRGLNYANSSKYDCMDAIRARGEE